jgi:cell division septum initiation protein DivIVA
MLGRTAVSKALVGASVAPTSLRLLDEVRSLRQRVAELEAALAAAEAAAAARSGDRGRAPVVAERRDARAGDGLRPRR